MRFKKNVTITIASIFTEFLLSLIPLVFMIYIFFEPDKLYEVFFYWFVIIILAIIMNVLFFIISLFCQIFIKTTYYISADKLVIEKKNKTKEIDYKDVYYITYSFGNLDRFYHKPTQVSLFNEKELLPLVSINNPPILMVYMLRKKCNKAKMRYYNKTRFLKICLLINGITLLCFILGKIFS